jgi:hypothetical protein
MFHRLHFEASSCNDFDASNFRLAPVLRFSGLAATLIDQDPL